jgi:hypothetical protein
MEQKNTERDFQKLYGDMPAKIKAVLVVLFNFGPLTTREILDLMPKGTTTMGLRVLVSRLAKLGCVEINSTRPDKVTGHATTVWQLTWQAPENVKKLSINEQLKKARQEILGLKAQVTHLTNLLEAKNGKTGNGKSRVTTRDLRQTQIPL